MFLFCCWWLPPAVVSAQAVITSVEVHGLSSLSREELLYLLDIRVGGTLDREEAGRGIKRAFMKGIFEDISVESLDPADTRIRVVVQERKVIRSITVSGNRHFSGRFVKKRFRIRAGERLNLRALEEGVKELGAEFAKRGFAHARVAYRVVPEKKNRAGITISIQEGQPEIVRQIVVAEPDDSVKSRLNLSEGDIFDQTKMDLVAKQITQHYRNLGYIGTALSHTYKEGVLEIKLDPGVKLDITFSGNTVFQKKALMKEIPFFEINEFSEDLLDETTSRITTLYHKSGYPFAEVAPVKAISGNEINLEFFIYEGERYKVDSVGFDGITIPKEKLTGIMAMRTGDPYNPELIEVNIDNLLEFYHALGYLYSTVQEPVIRLDRKKAEIEFSIIEGPQVLLDTVTVRDSRYFTEKEILAELPISPGRPYNEVDISEARRKISELYNRAGYLDAKVTVDREISGSAANVSFIVQEGEVTVFGKTIVTGNDHTKQRVVEREFLHKQDDPFDYSLLLRERQRLYRLGLFTDIEVSPQDKEGNKRDVLYRVKEANAGAVEVGIGYGEYEKYRGFLDISYKNLFGLNKQGSFRTELSTLEQRFILSYLDAKFMNTDLVFRTMALHEYRKEKNIDTKDILYKLSRDSITSGFEKKLSDTLRSELYYDFSFVKTSDVKPDVVLTKEDTGTLIISAVRPGLVYDTRDNPFEPRKGILAGASLKIASAVLFSQTDFLKATIYANAYQGLTKRLVLAASVRGGFAEGFGTTRELPLVERFFLGGRATVRGYDQDLLGPKGANGNPVGGNAFAMGNLELRTNLGRGVGIVTFLDGGNVWRKAEEVDIGDLKYTTGLGLRYNTPVGPFRVDYGYKLNRERGENRGAVHFSLGHAF